MKQDILTFSLTPGTTYFMVIMLFEPRPLVSLYFVIFCNIFCLMQVFVCVHIIYIVSKNKMLAAPNIK